MKSAAEIVALMLEKDAFSQWMQLSVNHIEPGCCELAMNVKDEMLNGFSILHGGLSYSLADSALAFAANSRGYKCVSIETSISHVRPVKTGTLLVARAIEIHRGKTIGIYEVTVCNDAGDNVAFFKGTVHISNEIW